MEKPIINDGKSSMNKESFFKKKIKQIFKKNEKCLMCKEDLVGKTRFKDAFCRKECWMHKCSEILNNFGSK